MDLHIHTPASADYHDRNITYLQILQTAEARGLAIMAITDHNTVAGYRAMWEEVELLLKLEDSGRLSEEEQRRLDEYRRISDKIMVLPGFEITATLGFHILGIFPPGTRPRKLEHILLDLKVPEDRLDQGSTEVGSTSDVLTCYRVIGEHGGLVIAAHANSTHGVAMMGLDFGGQTKIAYTQDRNLHALEVTDLESTSRRRTANFFNGSKPEYPRRMHCIQGSDCHRLDREGQNPGLGERATEVLLPEVSFESLRELFLDNDFSRTRPARLPAQAPFDQIKTARKVGPNLVQSFHEVFSSKPGRMAAIIADVVAFANTNGGTVYIGVSGNASQPAKGLDRPADEVVTALKTELPKNITPPLEVSIDVATTEGRKVVEIKVPKGPDRPYTLGTGQIYVRQESETTLALRDEIIRLVLEARRPAISAPPTPSPAPSAVPVTVVPATQAAKPATPPARKPFRPRPTPPPPLPTAPVAPPAEAEPPTPSLPTPPEVSPETPPVAEGEAIGPVTELEAQVSAVLSPELPSESRPAESRPAESRPAVAEAEMPGTIVVEAAPAVTPVAPVEALPPVVEVIPPGEAVAPVEALPPVVEVIPPGEAVAPVEALPPVVEVIPPGEAVAPVEALPPVVEVIPPGEAVAPVEALPPVVEVIPPGEAVAPVKPRRTRRKKATPAAAMAAEETTPPAETPPAGVEPSPPAPEAVTPELTPASPPQPELIHPSLSLLTEEPDLWTEPEEGMKEVIGEPNDFSQEDEKLQVPPPRTGVEVLTSEIRNGVWYHTVRDLRNGNVVHNVSRFSARHLWKYAIMQLEDHPVQMAEISWEGPIGLWKTYRRAGVKRYNLVQRDSTGKLHLYFGVTEEGIHGPWRTFLEEE